MKHPIESAIRPINSIGFPSTSYDLPIDSMGSSDFPCEIPVDLGSAPEDHARKEQRLIGARRSSQRWTEEHGTWEISADASGNFMGFEGEFDGSLRGV